MPESVLLWCDECLAMYKPADDKCGHALKESGWIEEL